MKTKNFLLLALLLCLSSPLFSQSSSSFDISVALERGYRTLSSDNGVGNLIIDSRVENESADLGYRFGINYNQRLGQRLWLRGGLRYAIIKYKEKLKDNLRWGSEYDPNTGIWTPDPDLPRQVQSFFSFHFFEVPVRLRYVFSEGRWQPYAEGGMSALFFRHLTTEVTTDLSSSKVKNESEELPNSNDLQFAVLLAFGSNYTLNDKLALFAQANYNHHLTTAFEGTVKERFYTIGLEAGLRVHL